MGVQSRPHLELCIQMQNMANKSLNMAGRIAGVQRRLSRRLPAYEHFGIGNVDMFSLALSCRSRRPSTTGLMSTAQWPISASAPSQPRS
jgi:hypothetical protein